jgi:hypothetical protein
LVEQEVIIMTTALWYLKATELAELGCRIERCARHDGVEWQITMPDQPLTATQRMKTFRLILEMSDCEETDTTPETALY